MRILLDTNLLVRGAISPGGSARQVLREIGNRAEHVLVLSKYLLSETADVLRRPRIRARWPLSDEQIDDYCLFLKSSAEDASPTPLPPAIRDPKDQTIIETAVAGRASVICTLDGHFFENPIHLFLDDLGIRVMTDVELLRLLREP